VVLRATFVLQHLCENAKTLSRNGNNAMLDAVPTLQRHRTNAMRAHAYKSLLGHAEDLIKGKHLLVVPAGALTTLPFQVLVTKPPATNDPASAAWLVRDHAITVLPSVASLAALRRTAKPSAATKPMVGFGNPLLDGDQKYPRNGGYYKELADLARSQIGCAAAPEQRTASLRALSRNFTPVAQTAGVADLEGLKRQTPLPKTADELCAVARSLDADTSEIRIGKRATETEVKRRSMSGELARYRILHFATHGVLAGQLSGTRKPGLILTPPTTATAEDDGYLSGSEIAALNLDAEWVILSACNTAGGAGRGEAAEALSGLARVFFYTGARSLLVSHWEVRQRRHGEAHQHRDRRAGEGQIAWTRRGVAARHALRYDRHLASRTLGAGRSPLRLGTVRDCGRGWWWAMRLRRPLATCPALLQSFPSAVGLKAHGRLWH
jgi:CHAT domain-containing protein